MLFLEYNIKSKILCLYEASLNGLLFKSIFIAGGFVFVLQNRLSAFTLILNSNRWGGVVYHMKASRQNDWNIICNGPFLVIPLMIVNCYFISLFCYVCSQNDTTKTKEKGNKILNNLFWMECIITKNRI